MSPTTPPPPPSIGIRKTVPSKTSPSSPAPRFSPDGKPQAGMGVSRRRLQPRRQTRYRQDQLRRRHRLPLYQPRRRHLRGPHLPRRTWHNTACSAGASAFSTWTTTAGSTSSSPTATSIPRSQGSKAEAPYAEHKYLYRNLRNDRFEEITDKGGPGINAECPRPRLRLRRLRQ